MSQIKFSPSDGNREVTWVVRKGAEAPSERRLPFGLFQLLLAQIQLAAKVAAHPSLLSPHFGQIIRPRKPELPALENLP
jgi:hypothetical protein